MRNALSKDSKLIILNRPLLVAERELSPMRPRMSGRFRLQTRKAKTGKLVEDTGWFNNLITDIGLNRLGTGAVNLYTHVGAGAADPQVTDTALGSPIASTSAVQSTDYNVRSTPPYYGWSIYTRRFGEGAAAGTVAEVGVGWGASGASQIYSRALVLDSLGVPTTITVLGDETLDVTYEHRLYPPLDDVAGSFDIGGVTYNYVARTAQVTSISWSGQYFSTYGVVGSSAPSMTPYNGTIGAITGSPTGSSASGASGSWQAYVDNSKERGFSLAWALNGGNVSGGINAFTFDHSYAIGNYQFQLDAHIPKDATKVMTLNGKVAWDRYVP